MIVSQPFKLVIVSDDYLHFHAPFVPVVKIMNTLKGNHTHILFSHLPLPPPPSTQAVHPECLHTEGSLSGCCCGGTSAEDAAAVSHAGHGRLQPLEHTQEKHWQVIVSVVEREPMFGCA